MDILFRVTYIFKIGRTDPSISFCFRVGDIVFPFIGTIISTPVFIQGLTQVMTLVTSFVADTFSGELGRVRDDMLSSNSEEV